MKGCKGGEAKKDVSMWGCGAGCGGGGSGGWGSRRDEWWRYFSEVDKYFLKRSDFTHMPSRAPYLQTANSEGYILLEFT